MNIACQQKRYFSPVTPEILRNRLGRQERNLRERLLVLDDGSSLIGACHVFYDCDEQIGYIAYLLSLPGEERTVWPPLLRAALSTFPRGQIVSMGSPYTPVYQSLEGRIQPLWGSTESLEIHSRDSLLIEFLAENGFTTKEHYFTMSKALTTSTRVDRDFELLRGADCWYNGYSWYGKTSSEEFGLRNEELSVLVQKKDGIVEGHVAWYPLRVLGRVAMCDLEVAAGKQRRGLGRALLLAALSQIHLAGYTSCELFLSPAQSPQALRLYLSEVFVVEEIWYEMVYQQKN